MWRKALCRETTIPISHGVRSYFLHIWKISFDGMCVGEDSMCVGDDSMCASATWNSRLASADEKSVNGNWMTVNAILNERWAIIYGPIHFHYLDVFEPDFNKACFQLNFCYRPNSRLASADEMDVRRRASASPNSRLASADDMSVNAKQILAETLAFFDEIFYFISNFPSSSLRQLRWA